jgi:hypothetical protein
MQKRESIHITHVLVIPCSASVTLPLVQLEQLDTSVLSSNLKS